MRWRFDDSGAEAKASSNVAETKVGGHDGEHKKNHGQDIFVTQHTNLEADAKGDEVEVTTKLSENQVSLYTHGSSLPCEKGPQSNLVNHGGRVIEHGGDNVVLLPIPILPGGSGADRGRIKYAT